MYREDGWIEGHYIDNHKKFECLDCEKEFIVGEKLLEDCESGLPICPYCGKSNVCCIACTEDDQLRDLGSDMGCLAITVDEGSPVLKRLAQSIRKYPNKEVLALDIERICETEYLETIEELADILEGGKR